MARSPSQIRALLADDVKRRNARKAAEVAAFEDSVLRQTDCPVELDPYLWSRSITGVPSQSNRTVRASVSSWDTTMRKAASGRSRAKRVHAQSRKAAELAAIDRQNRLDDMAARRKKLTDFAAIQGEVD
jgi:hypothetical protein